MRTRFRHRLHRRDQHKPYVDVIGHADGETAVQLYVNKQRINSISILLDDNDAEELYATLGQIIAFRRSTRSASEGQMSLPMDMTPAERAAVPGVE